MSGFILTTPNSAGGGGGSSIDGLAVTVINGQPMLTLEDTTRADKILSVAEQVVQFAENRLDHNDWIQIGNATDADSSFVADFNGTITFATGHCENTTVNNKDVHLYVNGVDEGSIGSLFGGTNAVFINNTLNVDIAQGDRIRLRAVDDATGRIEDTVIKLTFKWRG